jgi:MFS family permease
LTLQRDRFGLVVAIFTLGGLAGALSSERLTARSGRVGVLRTSAASVLLGSAATGIANTFVSLLIGRYVAPLVTAPIHP